MEIHNYGNRSHKWHIVTVFSEEPRDNPGKSKEGTDVAKFVGLGDAFNYADTLAKRPVYQTVWGIVIR